MRISEDTFFNILKEEYFKILDIIFHYDSLLFKLKAAFFFAIITLVGVIVKAEFDEGVWIIVIITILFWFIEATLKINI